MMCAILCRIRLFIRVKIITLLARIVITVCIETLYNLKFGYAFGMVYGLPSRGENFAFSTHKAARLIKLTLISILGRHTSILFFRYISLHKKPRIAPISNIFTYFNRCTHFDRFTHFAFWASTGNILVLLGRHSLHLPFLYHLYVGNAF